MVKRKDGRFHEKIKLPDGKYKYFYSKAKTERAARTDINQQIMAYEKKQSSKYTFKAIAEAWNKEYRETIPEITYNKQPRVIYNRLLEYFGDEKKIDKITASDVLNYISYLICRGYSKKTISNNKCILSLIFDYAVLQGFIKSNPVASVKLPNNLPKKKRELPPTEALKEISKHYEGFDLLPYFILYTGCRCSEALAIRQENIDFNNKVIKIRNHVIHNGNKPVYEPVLKTESARRDIILLDKLAEVIPKNFKGFLFSMNGDGKEPLTISALRNRWTAYIKKYNLPHITLHQLRHAYATMLFEAGIDVKDAQELMGHSDINLTRQIYTHIRNERKQETANKLNSFDF